MLDNNDLTRGTKLYYTGGDCGDSYTTATTTIILNCDPLIEFEEVMFESKLI